MPVLTPEKKRSKARTRNYSFNKAKFLLHTLWNVLAVLLGSVSTLIISVIVFAMQNLSDFHFVDALQNGVYDWFYDDVFAAILTLSVVLVLTYIVSFRRSSDEYLGKLSKFVDCLAGLCVVLCLVIMALEIIYSWNRINETGSNIGNLPFYNIIGIVSLVVCGFLQSFSHPEYFMAPPQNY